MVIDNVSELYMQGDTPMHRASSNELRGCTYVVDILLSHGATFNEKNYLVCMILLLSAVCHVRFVQLLCATCAYSHAARKNI